MNIPHGSISCETFSKPARPHQLVHLRLRAAAHDPRLAFAVGQHAGDELDLRMPRLIGVDQMPARLDGIGQAAQRAEHGLVVREQFIQAGDDGDRGPRRDGCQRGAIEGVAVRQA